MEEKVTKGNKYLISTKAETTVTDPESGWYKVIPANSQTVVVALSDKFTIEGDYIIRPFADATRTHLELNPSSAGGGSGEPEGIYVCYNEDKTDALAYNLKGLKNGSYLFYGCSSLASFEGDLSALISGDNMFNECTKLASFEGDLSALTSCYRMFCGCSSLASFKGDLSALENGNTMFYSCTKLASFESDLSALANGTNMFTASQLDKESALRIFNSIPTYTSGTYKLTIGIHVDHETDAEVLAAIENAKNKGWTVTTKWLGTATSGVSLLDLEEIYAKKEQDSEGMYVDSNGVRYMVDWGHMITSPDGTPAELGYKLYYSLDEALTEWGLTEYEDNTISNQ